MTSTVSTVRLKNETETENRRSEWAPQRVAEAAWSSMSVFVGLVAIFDGRPPPATQVALTLLHDPKTDGSSSLETSRTFFTQRPAIVVAA
jgi:hypothetical protein